MPLEDGALLVEVLLCEEPVVVESAWPELAWVEVELLEDEEVALVAKRFCLTVLDD